MSLMGRCSILWLWLPILDPKKLWCLRCSGKECLCGSEVTERDADQLEGKAEKRRGLGSILRGDTK